MTASAGRQLPSVGNLVARDRSNVRDLDRRHGGRVAVQSRELDLKRLAVWVDVHHSPYVADLQTFLRDRSRQNDPVVFCNHCEISPLARIRCHQPRRFEAPIDNPDRPGDPTVATFSLRRQRAVDNIFLAMRRLDDFPGLSNLAQSGNQQVGGIDGEAERLEEVRLQVSENRTIRVDSSAYESPGGMPWAQGIAGSNPVAPTKSLSQILTTQMSNAT
jgi:hypothetical protein